MGLLKKVLRKGLDKVLDGVGDEAARTVASVIRGAGGQRDDGRREPVAQSVPRRTEPQESIEQTMPEILAACFPAYEVQREVPASAFGWSVSPARPYSYCLYSGGYLSAVIMLTPHNRDNNAAFRNARAACAENGIPFINFYTHMPNERQYVVERIRSFL